MMGKYGCGNINDNGERLVDLCGTNNLVIGGTLFLHREIHKLTTLTKEEILDNHRLFYVPLKFQPKMKNWIYHHSTGFLNYTSVLSNSAILLGLPNAPRILFPNY